ncbi:right-handed parallel beta-helix repeat-containing protein, partial [Myxococcota bacterium]|nr:right-handed parallel beta-helix repeat-containing protein [Myxococcota bacterium]
PGVRTDAVAVSSAGGLLLSFDTAVSLPGGLHVADEDLVRWNGTTFSLALDGSSVGISPSNDVDGVDDLGRSTFLVSFESGGSVGSVRFSDEDVLRYASGVWSLERDGSTADADWIAADLDAMQMVPEPRGEAPLMIAALGLMLHAARRRGRMEARRIATQRSIPAAVLALPVLPLFVAFYVAPVRASEGLLEIHQTCAVNGGCFPGDAAGFPVTITATGSYRLSSNLTVPDEFTGAIRVTAPHVTIDLNGFGILGPVVCTGTPNVCTPSAGTGYGIQATLDGGFLGVSNGSIRGVGGDGLRGFDRSTIENLRVFSNRGYGIYVGENSTVTGSVSSENFVSGISAGSGSIVRGNAVARNRASGITDNCSSSSFSGLSVSENTVIENGSYGMFIDCEASVITRNTVYNHVFDGIYLGIGSTLNANAVVGNDRHGLANPGADDVSYTDNVILGSGTANIEPNSDFRDMGGNSCGGTAVCP